MNDIANQPQTTGSLLSRFLEIRAEREALSERDKALKDEAEAIEFELIRHMEEQGSTRVASTLGTAILQTQTLPQVEDWDAFYAFVKDNDALYLLQRRVSSPAFRELLEGGTEIPGVVPFEKKTVQVRKAR